MRKLAILCVRCLSVRARFIRFLCFLLTAGFGSSLASLRDSAVRRRMTIHAAIKKLFSRCEDSRSLAAAMNRNARAQKKDGDPKVAVL